MEPIAANRLMLMTSDGLEVPVAIAGVGARSFAFLIDWHIRLLLALAWLLAGLLVVRGPDLLHGADLSDHEKAVLTFAVAAPALVIYFLYHFVLEIAMQGRTPGKRIAGVRIVDRHGHTPGAGALLVRNLFRLVDSLPAYYLVGLVAALFSRESVRIGDLAAGTLLVYEERADRSRLAGVMQGSQRLPEAWRELLADLLERWSDLERPVRIGFAERLLTASAWPRPEQTADRSVYDGRLYLDLLRLKDDGAVG